jgi:hypothetical protein
MQNTIYESDENVAAAGVAQPGAHYADGECAVAAAMGAEVVAVTWLGGSWVGGEWVVR